MWGAIGNLASSAVMIALHLYERPLLNLCYPCNHVFPVAQEVEYEVAAAGELFVFSAGGNGDTFP